MPVFSPRSLRILLALSVALNLVVIGIVAGAALREPPRPRPDSGPAFGIYDRALTKEDREALREAFRREAPDFHRNWQKMQGDLAQLIAALEANPYDPVRAREVFERQRERGIEMMILGQRLMADHLAEMTPDERRAFAGRLQQRLDDREDRRR
ncbi:periplasmic heavy metal sensor [Falsirhodobacter deserti]|uniref:periplasmic heavy metal sensor n=1 Tax=Falsirhodobacter deserti TaxID=1365611 RepID=UPI0013E2E3DF|nr:periplasmic heavy metal sensor [Falsirhodobacter deserti]